MQDGQIKKKKISWAKLLCYALPQRSTPVKEP